jgi:hypothetical protein
MTTASDIQSLTKCSPHSALRTPLPIPPRRNLCASCRSCAGIVRLRFARWVRPTIFHLIDLDLGEESVVVDVDRRLRNACLLLECGLECRWGDAADTQHAVHTTRYVENGNGDGGGRHRFETESSARNSDRDTDRAGDRDEDKTARLTSPSTSWYTYVTITGPCTSISAKEGVASLETGSQREQSDRHKTNLGRRDARHRGLHGDGKGG